MKEYNRVKVYFDFMKRLLTLLAVIMILHVRATDLSPNAEVGVLTCSPGSESYTIFGHTAIRIRDSLAGIDVVFNYGTFDFDDPRFYQKFLRGRLLYFLSASPFADFLPEYQENGQAVWEQLLKLTTAEKQAIYDRLLDNLKEQHRYYKYDFLYDNCTTRVRDDIQSIRGIKWITPPPGGIRSFREQFGRTYSYNPWTGFGIDICTGLPADKRPSEFENLFLPQNLFDALERAHIVERTIAYDFRRPEVGEFFDWTAPVMLCWLLFGISVVILFMEIRLRARFKAFDWALFTVTGLVGLATLFLWTLTDHGISRWNLNLLWACPLNLLALFWARFRNVYYRIYSIVLVLLVVFMVIASRYLDQAILPLALTLLTRTVNRRFRWGRAVG